MIDPKRLEGHPNLTGANTNPLCSLSNMSISTEYQVYLVIKTVVDNQQIHRSKLLRMHWGDIDYFTLDRIISVLVQTNIITFENGVLKYDF